MAEPVRCAWCGDNQLLTAYHDREWGTPVHDDDRRQYEFLVLESAQAGLSWLTILRKREHYRRAFAGFDPQQVARFGDQQRQELLADAGIVRNRAKIDAAINNAARLLEVQAERGSFCGYLWSFVDGVPVVGHWQTLAELPAHTELSARVSDDLKRRGFRFLGPTTVYSHLQAMGVVNDHTVDCFRYRELVA